MIIAFCSDLKGVVFPHLSAEVQGLHSDSIEGEDR
jgi:hypothetical protein